jgi:contractile injection system tape measure protein
MQHLVKKQVIEITCSKRTDAFRMQQLISNHYWQDVVPLLSSVFNEISAEGKVTRIDKLEIDLGFISEKEMNEVRWNDEILCRIKTQLYEKLVGKEKDKVIVHEVARMSICKQWLFYMQKGYLPWNVLRIDQAWYYKVLEVLASDFSAIAELRKLIRQYPGVIRRIIEQHDENYLIKLVGVLTAVSQRELMELLEELAQLVSSHAIIPALVSRNKKSEVKKGIWYWVFAAAAAEQSGMSSLELIEKILADHSTHDDIVAVVSESNTSSFAHIFPIIKKLHDKPEQFSVEKSSTTKKIRKAEEKKKEESDTGLDEEGIFVVHAGVVLIHTFLTSLFKRLQLLKDSAFANKETQQKSIYLVHYLAAGTVDAEEHELVVPKVLCEWPISLPVEKNVEITQEELNEADNMLEAAIEQWPVLKNTSISGLREGFLQRNGKIFTKNEKMQFQVEANSLDVLLDQLPWNISIIKLSWMKAILRVDWR